MSSIHVYLTLNDSLSRVGIIYICLMYNKIPCISDMFKLSNSGSLLQLISGGAG